MLHAKRLVAALLGSAVLAGCGDSQSNSGDTTTDPTSSAGSTGFAFTAVQPDIFGAPGAQPNAWADYDADGDLDLYVGFRGAPNRLYRNDGGTFVDTAPSVGLDVEEDTRAIAWGDFDSDGDLDVYVGFPVAVEQPDRLYRNDGGVFTNVASDYGLMVEGTTRQTSWIDLDGDGDLDLFVALRDRPNRMFRNDGSSFVDITEATGLGDPRRTVGVVWFDYEADGDLDLFVANQNGDQDAFFRNDGGVFSDIAPELGMDWPDRADDIGGVGPAVTDYDGDGDLDLFVANYGPDVLWRNEGDGSFTNVTEGLMGADVHSTTSAWGDADNDGDPDLYVAAFLGDVPEAPDHLFRNEGSDRFVDATPAAMTERGASHGVRWVDYDADGDLDLALANNNAVGSHPLYRNDLGAELRARSLQVRVRLGSGQGTVPGAEVHASNAQNGEPLGARLVDTGGGYCSQGVEPVFFAFAPGVHAVDITVIVPAGGTRTAYEVGRFELAEVGGSIIDAEVSP